MSWELINKFSVKGNTYSKWKDEHGNNRYKKNGQFSKQQTYAAGKQQQEKEVKSTGDDRDKAPIDEVIVEDITLEPMFREQDIDTYTDSYKVASVPDTPIPLSRMMELTYYDKRTKLRGNLSDNELTRILTQTHKRHNFPFYCDQLRVFWYVVVSTHEEAEGGRQPVISQTYQNQTTFLEKDEVQALQLGFKNVLGKLYHQLDSYTEVTIEEIGVGVRCL